MASPSRLDVASVESRPLRPQQSTRPSAVIPIHRSVAPWIFLAVVLALPLTRGLPSGDFAPQSDSPVHLVTGFYFADLIKDFPVRHPVEYTYRYYAQYPALGLIHWPPLFHVAEGVAFLVAPRSVTSAKILVLLFAFVGLYAWIRLIRNFHDDWAASLSAVLLALAPGMLGYEKAVMLEIPSLALCIAAIYFWVKYLRTGAPRSVYYFAVLSGLALLTKQHSIFLLLFCALTLLAARRWDLLLSRHTWFALLVSAVMVLPFYLVAFSLHASTIAGDVFVGSRQSNLVSSLTFYWLKLPRQIGIPLLVLSAIGLATWRRWTTRANLAVVGLWIVSCYLLVTFFAQKDVRYAIYWIPPFVYFAIGPFLIHVRQVWARALQISAVLLLVAYYSWLGWTFTPQFVSGYSTVASNLMSTPGMIPVLYDGNLGADFISHVRLADPERRCIVLRKELYLTRWMKEYGNLELVHSKAEIEDLLTRDGIRYIVVEDGIPLDFTVQKTLREFLQDSQFRLLESVPISSNASSWAGRKILLYENLATRGSQPPEVLHVKMLTLDHDIVVPLHPSVH